MTGSREMLLNSLNSSNFITLDSVIKTWEDEEEEKQESRLFFRLKFHQAEDEQISNIHVISTIDFVYSYLLFRLF